MRSHGNAACLLAIGRAELWRASSSFHVSELRGAAAQIDSREGQRPRLPPSIRQGRVCARESTALTTKPPGGGEEAHRRWPEGRSEWGASKAKQRPPSRKIMFDFIPKNSETWA